MQQSEAERDGGAAAPATAGVGETLRSARNARALTIEQVSIELRIEPQQLRALEEERFDSIGPPVFVKGYLRHYCMLLGVDAGDVLERYQRLAGEREIALQPSRTIKLRNDRQILLWIAAALALAIVVAVLFFWWRGAALPFLDGFGLPQRSAAAATRSYALYTG